MKILDINSENRDSVAELINRLKPEILSLDGAKAQLEDGTGWLMEYEDGKPVAWLLAKVDKDQHVAEVDCMGYDQDEDDMSDKLEPLLIHLSRWACGEGLKLVVEGKGNVKLVKAAIEVEGDELKKFYRKLAVNNFNKTWDYIDKTDRTLQDDLNMIHSTHLSMYYWSLIGTPVHFARGEWQISRVYALVGNNKEVNGQYALEHGMASLKWCLDNDIKDFDLAFGYEAVARAYKVFGDQVKQKEYVELALKAANDVAKKDDRDYSLSEIKNLEL